MAKLLNRAAWLEAPKSSLLVVKEAPYPRSGPRDLTVQVQVVAINPLEYKIQDTNPPLGGKAITYPTILGADLGGVVVSVGEEVKSRKAGDRIIANTSGLGKSSAAFQEFVVLPEHYATSVPDDVKIEEAVVLPLACDTAAAGLFVPDRLGLSTKRLLDPSLSQRNEVILVWGGSSSVGCCAIQLAHAAGYEVITTASLRNHELCRALGAQVFDHAKQGVEDDIVTAMQGKIIVGALDCISNDKTISACVRLLARTTSKKVVTVLTPPETVLDGIEVQRLSIPSLLGTDVYSQVHEFMSAGLADRRLQPRPEPFILGRGLETIQQGIDKVRNGVSAMKVVIRIA